jgi:hypothetical protein
MTPQPEPRNPFYLLLLAASLLFLITALAYALVPTLEEKAAEAGSPPPPSQFRTALRLRGWVWLLYEVAAMGVLALASMALDRVQQRRLQNAQPAGTMPSMVEANTTPATVKHVHASERDSRTPPPD